MTLKECSQTFSAWAPDGTGLGARGLPGLAGGEGGRGSRCPQPGKLQLGWEGRGSVGAGLCLGPPTTEQSSGGWVAG